MAFIGDMPQQANDRNFLRNNASEEFNAYFCAMKARDTMILISLAWVGTIERLSLALTSCPNVYWASGNAGSALYPAGALNTPSEGEL